MNKAELAQRFQQRGEEYAINIHIYLPSPATIHEMQRLEYWGKNADDKIKDLQATIETLQAYNQMLYDRAQELAAAPWHHEIHLIRKKDYYDNKVFYYLKLLKVYDAAGIEPETLEDHKYPGTDRRQAIKDFEAYQKSHPGIIAVKDIEKGKWER